MARIAVGKRSYEIDLVAFDKDGTLIDFYHLWGARARLAVAAVAARLGDDDGGLAARLYRGIGYDPATGLAEASGPLAITSIAKLTTVCAVVLYQHGLDWHSAEALAHETFAAALGAPPTPDLVRPIGAAPSLCARLRAAGVTVAVVTSDDRAATLETLRLLGIADHVAALVCGDDPIPNKPAPDALLHLGRTFGVPPERMMMVGDTIGDMATGRNAGIACCAAVLSGAGQREELAVAADHVIASVSEINILD
jgi:phosphoglycolate phosphatase-like HAD superfamily hydrolase